MAPAAAGCPGIGVAVSCRGVPDGVADLVRTDESAEDGRCGSCRKLAWRG